MHYDHDSDHKDPAAQIDRILAKHGAAVGCGILALERPRTPLEHLIAQEEGHTETDYAVQNNTLHKLLDYLFQSGPDPREVVQNIYAVATALDHPAISHFTLEDLAAMFGNGRAAMSWRVKKLWNQPLEAAGFKATHAKRQKREVTCEKYRQAQLGNRNRARSKRPPRDLAALLCLSN